MSSEAIGIIQSELDKSNATLTRFDRKEYGSSESIKLLITTKGVTQLTAIWS